ncbi:hypothetical protein DPMN_123316 [Dreissena polymorpha]|uniref:AMP-binding enzyme C-terminal domain-containing protein n=2 Tax=Dreissena polymorpha TaxID=45954 RepID=A0A9D4GX74_DREPO|nr:hypothetical protein DPMN_123316 [Dreissena polymorpha]
MKLVDDNWCVVPKGESGELLVRCAWRFRGYKTKEFGVDDLNWFHTGDVAFLRDNHQLVINGRKKELISIGTSKFLPWQIEEVLRKCPGVANAFAFGVPDPRLKQIVCACVVPKSGVQLMTDDLVKYCDDTILDEDPALVVCGKPTYHVILEKVPLLASGRINRLEICRTAIDKLGP